MLGRQVAWTRQILTKLLVGKMTLTPITLADGSAGYELSGKFRYDRLLSGILTPNSRGVTSPTGFSHPACLNLPVDGYSPIRAA